MQPNPYFPRQSTTVNVGSRFGSMILDHFIMTIIAVLFSFPIMIQAVISGFNVSHEQPTVNPFEGPLGFVALLGFALYFCKDCIKGRSPGKRITKLQVLNNSTGEVASPLRCFIRNIFIVIWPIEAIIALANPPRRLGDIVAGTKVAVYEPALTAQPKPNFTSILGVIAFSYGLLLLIWLPLRNLGTFTEPRYVKSSYNASLSKTLEQTFSDSLGHYLTASVKVYDKVENANSKYVSVIFTLKENYLEDESTKDQLRGLTNKIIFSAIPKDNLTGRSQYIYRNGANMNMSSNSFSRNTSVEN